MVELDIPDPDNYMPDVVTGHVAEGFPSLSEQLKMPWYQRWGPAIFTALVMVLTTLALVFQDTVRAWVLRIF